jgi:hypothetical protein
MAERRRFKHKLSLEQRLADEAARLREEAKGAAPGSMERELLLRKARQAETGSHINEWLGSRGLQPPK